MSDENERSGGSVAGDIVCRLTAWRDERGFPTPGEMMDEAAAEIARLRLTDAEREAIEFMLRHAAYAADIPAFADSGDYRLHHDTLFARLK